MSAASLNDKPIRQIGLLTAGKDTTYALGLAKALVAQDCALDFIGSDLVNPSSLPDVSRIRYLNLRGDQEINVSLGKKAKRVLIYYARLIGYAATAKPRIFHILWVNKFEWFDETVLMLYYKLLGKKVCFTAHNINKAKRDGHDSWLNRLALRIQYQLCDHIFVHTAKMKSELAADFSQPEAKISVIPLGRNEIVPATGLTPAEARQRLGLGPQEKVLLFYGNIAPYKGLEILVAAFNELAPGDARYRLVIAGRPKGPPEYWGGIKEAIDRSPACNQVMQVIEYVPEEETEIYFKAADVSVLPYLHIFQSGVLTLSYTFGLPVIAADVGSLRDEIVTGKTGLVFEPKNVADLARTIRQYFDSRLYAGLAGARQEIMDYAAEKYSWTKVATITTAVYAALSGSEKR